MTNFKLGILASNHGSNLQAIIDACDSGIIQAEVSIVISNNSKSMALKRSNKKNIPSFHISNHTHPDPHLQDIAINKTLKDHNVNLVILAGYMKKLGPLVLKHYKRKIINIHPSLLPKYGGKGMYGMLVHREVIKSKEKITGISIHIVEEEYDSGPIIDQIKIPIDKNENAESLSKKISQIEHDFYVKTIGEIITGKIDLNSYYN